jgi:hypothetical protein
MKKLLLLTGIVATLSFTASYAQDAAPAKGADNIHRMAVQKTEKMAKELSLNEEQKKSVMQINLHQAQNIKQGAGKGEIDRSEKEVDARFKIILDAKQYAKYQEIKRRGTKDVSKSENAKPAEAKN